MSDDREAEVLALIAQGRQRLTRLAESRCVKDGRLLGATYRLPDGIWVWSVGRRQPPQAVRHEAVAFHLDAMDDCSTDEEVRGCYDSAIEAMASATRQKASPSVMKIEPVGPGRWSYGLTRPFAMSIVSGPNFTVTEVSCGCRRQYYLDVYALAKASIGRKKVETPPVHVPLQPPDLPERHAQALL
ncbi:hypothetical protein ACFWDB_07130 [Micromonospora chalcea]|uniref:hypothetical protein n=1 Tax=Micromonospora sp. TSRI0369 TaxID=1703936 RepID=UPI000A3EFAE8|nr:hypothetical protein [Micromonospora sp. TSRI0369]